MKKTLLVLLLLSCSSISQAAITADAAWEVRQAGDDLNGGCFDTGASGTDFSLQDAAQDSGTDLATVDNDTVSSATHNFDASDVGNCINISAGTGFTAGYYIITAVASNNADLDRAVGTHPLTGGTWRYGGAVGGTADWTFAASVVAGNTVHIKADSSYTHTATILAVTIDGTAAAPITWVGYQTTRGDDTGTRPTLTSATNSIALVTVNGADYNYFRNIKFTHTAATRGIAISYVTTQSNGGVISNCVFDGVLSATTLGAVMDDMAFVRNLVQNTTGSGFTVAASGTGDQFLIHGNVFYNVGAGAGTFHALSFTSSSGTRIISHNVFSTSSGSGYNSSFATGSDAFFFGNVFENNAVSGIADAMTTAATQTLVNNIFWSNGAYGVNYSGLTAATMDTVTWVNRTNAYGDNTTAARNNISAGTGDVTITGDPFISLGAGLDWDIDNTADQGAALRAVGFPGAVGGTGNTNTTGYLDIGVSQHQDSGSGGTRGYTFVQ